MMNDLVNSPSLPVDAGIVRTPKEFSDGLTLDLTDAEISQALRITLPIKQKWQARFRSAFRHQNFTVDEAMKLVDQFEDELVTELATKMDLIATVDVTGVFEGEPPVIEFVGCLPSHSSAKYGVDHERKGAEVKTAQDRNQAFLGIDKIGL
jgi:hypothetical protein